MASEQIKDPGKSILRDWSKGVDLKTDADDDIRDFIKNRTILYKEEENKGADLYYDFVDDFGAFRDPVDFRRAGAEVVRKLRDTLRRKGVYVPRDNRPNSVPEHLVHLIDSGEPPEWDENDKDYPHISHMLQKSTPNPCPEGVSDDRQVQRTTQRISTWSVDESIHEENVRIATYNPRGYSRELAILAKMYVEQHKYSGEGDTFDYKFDIFMEVCENADVPKDALELAFSTMLTGAALDFYFANKSTGKYQTLEAMCRAIKSNFEGVEYRRTLLAKWNQFTLESVIKENEGKDIDECLKKFTQRLRVMQHGLSLNLRNNEFIHNKIVTACEGHPAFRNVCQRPPNTLSGLLNDLRSAASYYDRTKEQVNQTLFTDRRYHRTQSDQNQGKGNQFTNRKKNFKKRCLVCKKEGCWSSNHPDKERNEALNKLNRKFQQFCLSAEGQPPNEEEEDSSQSSSHEEELDHMLESYVFEVTLPSEENSTTSNIFITESKDEINGEETTKMLGDQAAVHALTGELPSAWTTTLSRYGPLKFQGIIIDTGAAGCSTGGYNQFVALQEHQDRELKLDRGKKNAIKIQFGIGAAVSMGSVEIETPIGSVEFHIVEADTPFLLCLQDMDVLGAYLNNLTNKVHRGTKTYPVVRRFGHAFLTWGKSLTSYITQSVYLSESELRQLHRRFGHPSARRFADMLDRSKHDVDRNAIDHLTRHCKACQKHGSPPRRFKFTLRDPEIQFNHTIIVDIMYIDNANGSKPVLHIVDEATRFQAARWLKDVSSQTVWNNLRLCWIDTYLGPPDVVSHDAGTQFTSVEFKQLAASMAIATEQMPVEAHNSIGIVERYHLPLRRAYAIIVDELKGAGNSIDKEMALQMAVKAINDTAGPSGLVPTLLVFGTYPRMTKLDPPAPSIAVRARAIEKAMAEISKLRIDRQIADALRQRNGPQAKSIHELPLNSKVWVWRENEGWTGPHTLLSVDGETCTIQLPSGPVKFRSTAVKPFFDDTAQHESQEGPPRETQEENSQVRRNASRQRQLPNRYRHHTTNVITTFLSRKELLDLELSNELRKEGKITAEGPPFFLSRRKELDGLRANGVFEIVSENENPGRLFKSRFVDEVKGKATDNPFEKSRLVIQAYSDVSKKSLLTQSPTIQRVSQRIILCIAASTEFGLYLRDVSQAYVQSKTRLNRSVFAKPPKEIADQLPARSVMKILKPLYGIPEAGTHWFGTYHKHHIEKLFMVQSTYDPCLLYTKKEGLFGVVGLQTDDTLFVANDAFVKLENDELEKASFLAKPLEALATANTLMFNGCIIRKNGSAITLTQKKQGDKIQLIDTNTSFKDEYVAQRARGAYIASICQPEATFDLSFAAQCQNPSKVDVKALNKRLQWQCENREKGLRFIPIDLESAKLFIFVDASFANNKDFSSQMGFVMTFANEQLPDDDFKNGTFRMIGNVVHWSSIKCKRITRSVLASELYAMVHGFDSGIAIKGTLEKILRQLNLPSPIPLVLCTDSHSLYDCLVKLGTTSEKRLMIDTMSLRQSYEKREITEIRWIDGRDNPADGMTKRTPCGALKTLIDSNQLEVRVDGWVERKSIIT